MPLGLLIALGAGIVSAIAFASAAVGHPLAAGLFFLLTPLSLFLTGLSLGWKSAALAGVVGAAFLSGIGTLTTGAFYLASTGAPSAFLCFLALQSRPAAAGAEADAAGLEWYPPGRLVVWIAIIAALLSVLLVSLLGGTREALEAKVTPAIEGMIKNIPTEMKDAPGLGEKDIPQLVEIAVTLLPAAAAVLPMISFLFNLWLAGRVTNRAGHLIRPWPDLAAMTFPTGTPFALLAGMLLSIGGGIASMAGTALSGTFFIAYVVMGLAILHYVTRGAVWRPFALSALYVGMFVISGGVTLIVALIGLVDALFPIRRRASSGRGPPGT